MKNQKSQVSTFLKIAVSIALLVLVFNKIPIKDIWKTTREANLLFLALGLFTFILSQIVSAYRLLGVLHKGGYKIKTALNNRLYILGMFYNFFIPGGIGGDAYKVYVLNKHYKWPVKKLTAAMLYDRLMGLVAIGIILLVLAFWLPNQLINNIKIYIGIALIAGILFSFLFSKKVFPSFHTTFFKTTFLSLVVQTLQCTSIVFLLISMKVINHIIFLITFLISSILSIFSFSGIGVREFIFLKASQWAHFDSATAVTLGVQFSVLTAIVSIVGIYYHFKGIVFIEK